MSAMYYIYLHLLRLRQAAPGGPWLYQRDQGRYSKLAINGLSLRISPCWSDSAGCILHVQRIGSYVGCSKLTVVLFFFAFSDIVSKTASNIGIADAHQSFFDILPASEVLFLIVYTFYERDTVIIFVFLLAFLLVTLVFLIFTPVCLLINLFFSPLLILVPRLINRLRC